MIVLVLVVIWMVALAPFVLRRFSERQLTSSVAQFRRLTGMFGRRGPQATYFHEAVVTSQPMDTASADEERRVQRARRRVRHERRRRTLVALGAAGAFTLVVGAIPALRMLWDLTIADAIVTVGYLGLLAYFTRLENFEAERRAMRNVVAFPPRPSGAPMPQAVFAAVGGSSMSSMPAPIQLRPAFRIVDAPR